MLQIQTTKYCVIFAKSAKVSSVLSENVFLVGM